LALGGIRLELKYEENPLWKVNGMIWLVVGIVNVVLIIFLFNSYLRALGSIVAPFIVITIFINFRLAYYYFKLKTVNYLLISDSTLSIHKGLVIPRKVINTVDIKSIRLIGNDFLLSLQNGKDMRITTSLLSPNDRDRFKKRFKKVFNKKI